MDPNPSPIPNPNPNPNQVGHDTALTDFVAARTTEGGEDFAPPPEFYARFARLLEETYGALPAGARQ